MKGKVKPGDLPEGIEPGRLVWRGNGKVWQLCDRSYVAGYRGGDLVHPTQPILFHVRKVTRRSSVGANFGGWLVWVPTNMGKGWWAGREEYDTREQAKSAAVQSYLTELRESVLKALAPSPLAP